MAEKYIVTMNEYNTACKQWLKANPDPAGMAWSAWWKWIQMKNMYIVHDDEDLITVPQISYRRIKALNSPHWRALLKAMEIQDVDSNQG